MFFLKKERNPREKFNDFKERFNSSGASLVISCHWREQKVKGKVREGQDG